MSYYYLVASLPTLVLGEPPPYTAEIMLTRCANVLEKEDLAELAKALEGRVHEGVTDFAKRWVMADTQLRNAIVRVRAGKLGVEPRDYLKDHSGWDVSIEKAVVDAYAKPNPLERELAIDRHRWQMLDEMILAEPFGFSTVLAFALKLRIVTRWAGMKDEAGRAKVQETMESLAEAER